MARPPVDITTLFRRHHAELVRLAVMLVGDRSAAEDVVPVLPPQGGTAFADAW